MQKIAFDRVCVINLKRRQDRLKQFWKQIEEVNWPFLLPVVVPAVDGARVPHRDDFRSGNGAWGCLNTHSWILAQALTDGVHNLLVLEDDVFFVEDFKNRVLNFLNLVPADWDGLMLGGQHIGEAPARVRAGVVRCRNTQRTHCYAVRGRWLKDLYKCWQTWHTHCDHLMGSMMSNYNVYAPEDFLAGQDETPSDITGVEEKRRLWHLAKDTDTIFLLTAPKEVVEQLRQRHRWHYGYWLDENTGQDMGLQRLFSYRQNICEGLKEYVCTIIREAKDKNGVPCVWHPGVSYELLKTTGLQVLEIKAETVAQALVQKENYDL